MERFYKESIRMQSCTLRILYILHRDIKSKENELQLQQLQFQLLIIIAKFI